MLAPFALGLAIAVGSTVAIAAERTFQRPTYKNGPRLDVCFGGNQCNTQMAADAYCRVQGYEKATKFDKQKARPTELIAQKRICDADFCEAFTSITCSVSGQPGSTRDWPTRID
jgi:hypothetical protein